MEKKKMNDEQRALNAMNSFMEVAMQAGLFKKFNEVDGMRAQLAVLSRAIDELEAFRAENKKENGTDANDK